ncbi:hypothetical protein C8J57DRAFT_1483160 [Mycena rebaudengoi]|nr:hypothetical protein C8J57DRAFT_1483160 [Mycena rebaudengoi]
MTQRPDSETNSFSSDPHELKVLLSRVATLVQMSIDMTRIAADVQHRLPIVLAHHVDDALQGVPQMVADQVAVLVPQPRAAPTAPTYLFVACPSLRLPWRLSTLLVLATTRRGM